MLLAWPVLDCKLFSVGLCRWLARVPWWLSLAVQVELVRMQSLIHYVRADQTWPLSSQQLPGIVILQSRADEMCFNSESLVWLKSLFMPCFAYDEWEYETAECRMFIYKGILRCPILRACGVPVLGWLNLCNRSWLLMWVEIFHLKDMSTKAIGVLTGIWGQARWMGRTTCLCPSSNLSSGFRKTRCWSMRWSTESTKASLSHKWMQHSLMDQMWFLELMFRVLQLWRGWSQNLCIFSWSVYFSWRYFHNKVKVPYEAQKEINW